MMTRAGKIMFALYGLLLIGTVRAGSIALGEGVWDLAATLYAIAAVGLLGMLREVSRAELVEEDGQGPRWLTVLRNRIRARRHRPDACSCDTWWETLGEAHSGTCPRGAPRRSNYLAEAEDE